MSPSIRTFLLINLLLSVTLITSLAIIGNLFLEHRELKHQLDAQLTLESLTIQALLSDSLEARNLAHVQKEIRSIPKRSNAIYYNQYHKHHELISEKMQFQVIDQDGKVVLNTESAPEAPLTLGSTGFSNKWIDNKPWRIFSTYNPDTGLTIAVAERYDFRRQAEAQITRYAIFIMLISYPFLGLLIWVVVDRGLESIKRIASEVRSRSQNYLEPVHLDYVPQEIQPLIDSLNHLFDRLNDAIDREKRFASDAAHELNTPLAGLNIQLQLIKSAKTEEERNKAIDKALTGIQRSHHVVKQLLTLSRTVPDALQEKNEPVDIKAIAEDVISDLIYKADAKMTEIELKTPQKQCKFNGYPTAISILLRNLIDNAIRYTDQKSEIIVSVEQTKDHVILKVADNGPGIPEELHNRVFERFYRVVGTKKKGSGLGLGIVQQIAKLHNAKVSLGVPKWGKGLEITINFPRET